MNYKTYNKAKSNKLGFLQSTIIAFIKVNWFMILCAFLVLPYLYRYYKKQQQLNEEQEQKLEKDRTFTDNKNPIIQQQRADKITSNKELQSVTKKIAHDLGTKYSDKNSAWSWLDYQGWTENDDEVTMALIKYRNYYPTIQRLYFGCYSNSRNLSDDLVALLDDKNLKRLKGSIKI